MSRANIFAMKYMILVPILLLIGATYALTIDVIQGDVRDLGSLVLSPFAIVKGSISFKVGEYSWYPQEIWIIPVGTNPDQFRSASSSNELPSNSSDLGKCTTNIYTNATIGTAYKITASNINKGVFCAAISAGSYEVLAK